MEPISKIIKSLDQSRDYRSSHEFQAFGNRLAEELGDKKHRALYIKLAKTVSRDTLERAKEFALGSNTDTKGKLFMWKLDQLIKEK